MINKRLTVLISLAVLALGGCATMNGDECATSDWQSIGFEDGSRGYLADRIGSHRKACAKYGVTPDLQEYQIGHEQGLDNFCQPSRGFSLGVNGGSYNGVCAAHQEADFVDAYNSGYHLYNLRSRVSVANSQIGYKQRELDNIEELIKDKEVVLIAAETSTEDRVRIVADLKDLAAETGQLDAEIDQLIRDRARFEQDLISYEAVLADTGH